MDETIAKWILEFLLRQPSINENVINGVLEFLPLSDDDYRLKKMLLLRKIESEISTGSFSENILELLEKIDELVNGEGKTASDLMKEAYCAVAVDCTARLLEDDVKKNAKYFEAVERVWRNRVCTVETLGSEEMSRWWGDIEAAVWDLSVCEKIFSRNTRNDALRAIRKFLKEAWTSMGPSFLELVALKLGDKVEKLRLEGGVTVHGNGDGDATSSGNHCREIVSCHGIQKGRSLIRRKHVTVKTKRPRGAKLFDVDEVPEGSMNTANNVPIHETDKEQINTSTAHVAHDIPRTSNDDNNDVHTHCTEKVQEAFQSSPMRESESYASEAARLLSFIKMSGNSHHSLTHCTEKVQEAFKSRPMRKVHTSETARPLSFVKITGNSNNASGPLLHSSPEVIRVQKALKTSTKDLHAAVTDPLPEAIQTAETLCSNGVSTNSHQSRVEIHMSTDVGPIQQNLEPNTMEVQAAVRDPSLDAPRAIKDFSYKVPTNSTRNYDVLTHQIEPDVQEPIEPSENNLEKAKKKDKLIEGAQGHEVHDARDNLENVKEKDKINGDAQAQSNRKRSLMEPNGTGHTFEWDDSIDDSSIRERVTLPSSSKRSKVSPLQPYIPKSFSRRERRKWTPQEEDVLREAVKKFGRRWKFILEHYSDAFSDRTDVDLKDKWRNLVKYSAS